MCCSLRNLSTVHHTGLYLVVRRSACFITDDVINTVEGRLLYGKMSYEAQIPVPNIPNVPHVVFSIVWPNDKEYPQDRDKVRKWVCQAGETCFKV